ncbi:MAG: cytochrome c oxidase assembly protein [Pseudomonadota bacterium]
MAVDVNVKPDAASGSESEAASKKRVSGADARVAIYCSAVVFGMLGMSYAAVPLYQIFCQVTGFAGTTQRADAPSSVMLPQNITMRFDANTSSGLDWSFRPKTAKQTVQLGENRVAVYLATNKTDQPLWGTATFNVTPESAGIYFNKIECFCFTEQLLKPGESVEMPVNFFVDPDIVKDKDAKHITQITLSYTFFPLDKTESNDKRADTKISPTPSVEQPNNAG